MKTVNQGLVRRDVLQLGKYGTSKEFFSLKRYSLLTQGIWHIVHLCFSLMDTTSLQKNHLQTTDLDRLYISTTP